MASPEENMQAALDRAAKFRESGNLERAAVWEASADRYKRIIEAKQRIETAKQNVEEIRERIEAIKAGPTPIISSRNVGKYSEVTQEVDPGCPSGVKRIRINYVDGKEASRDDLGCMAVSTISDRSGTVAAPYGKTTPVVNPTPPVISAPVVPTPPPPPVKTAPIDTVLFNDDSVPIEIMTDLIFEDIGGQELINIVRNDTIIGQNLEYLPIKNITSINRQYDPNNILSLQNTSNKIFSNFVIPIDDKIPKIGNGPGNSFIYLDPDTGNLIIELINLSLDNEIQVAFMTGGTIYEAEFNES